MPCLPGLASHHRARSLGRVSAVIDEWRFCTKCHGLFGTEGQRDAGTCPAGGAHHPQGLTFRLPVTAGETPRRNAAGNSVGDATRYSGAGDRRDFGHCPGVNKYSHFHSSGGGAPDYLLYHDVVPKPGTQRDWRFCGKCRCLFTTAIRTRAAVLQVADTRRRAGTSCWWLAATRDAGHPIDPGTVLHPVNE